MAELIAKKYSNPTPVAVIVLPVDDGYLILKRTIEPYIGSLAFPGGYVNTGETWQEACSRELLEEAGVSIKSQEISLIDVKSSVKSNVVLIFGKGPQLKSKDIDLNFISNESAELQILTEFKELAFPLHSEVFQSLFDKG